MSNLKIKPEYRDDKTQLSLKLNKLFTQVNRYAEKKTIKILHLKANT